MHQFKVSSMAQFTRHGRVAFHRQQVVWIRFTV